MVTQHVLGKVEGFIHLGTNLMSLELFVYVLWRVKVRGLIIRSSLILRRAVGKNNY